MCIFLKNTIVKYKLYNALSASAAAISDALAERLQSVHETASLLYNKMIGIGYGRKKPEDEGTKEKQQDDDEQNDMAPKIKLM